MDDSYGTFSPSGRRGAAAGNNCYILAGLRRADLKCWTEWLRSAGVKAVVCCCPPDLERMAGPGATAFVSCEATGSAAWFEAISRLRRRIHPATVIILAEESSEDLAIQALRAGACDYIRGPVDRETLVRLATRHRAANPAPLTDDAFPLLGESRSMLQLRQLLERLSMLECNVLITGESGTGKELAAMALHRLGRRRHARLVSLNCAAVPESLIESELFGHEKGAFTGADARREGKFKAADGGVLFLDEVGDLSPVAQAKILRAVETKEIVPLGSNHTQPVNVRIVAATHRHLEEMVAEGKFRQDLYFRLNIGRIRIPPIRERIEDIRLLLDHYLHILNQANGTSVEGFSPEAMNRLLSYSWPGNVRELKNLVEATLVIAISGTISFDDLPPHLQSLGSSGTAEQERSDLIQVLTATKWNKTQAAAKLKWSRMTLYRKMAKHSLGAPHSTRTAAAS